MNRYGPTQYAKNLASCPRDGKNMQELTQNSSFYTKTNQGTEGQHMRDHYVTSDHRKQRLQEQDSPQEGILYIIQEKPAHQHKT